MRFEQQAVSKAAEVTSGTSFIEEKSGSTGVSGCVDIDECLKDHGCHRFADCINSPGKNISRNKLFQITLILCDLREKFFVIILSKDHMSVHVILVIMEMVEHVSRSMLV